MEKRRKVRSWQTLKQHSVIAKNKMVMPKKDIPVVIREGLIVYTNDPSKIEEIKQRFADKY